MQIKSINAPLVMIGKTIRVTRDRWTEIDPDKLDAAEREQFDSLTTRGLIGIHPNDNAGKPVPMRTVGTPRADDDSLKARVRELEAENRRLRAELGEDDALASPTVSTPAARAAEAAKDETPRKDEASTKSKKGH